MNLENVLGRIDADGRNTHVMVLLVSSSWQLQFGALRLRWSWTHPLHLQGRHVGQATALRQSECSKSALEPTDAALLHLQYPSVKLRATYVSQAFAKLSAS